MNITRVDAASRPRRAMRSAILASGVLLGAVLPAAATEGVASFYGRSEHGGPTASGERFDMHAMTAAHRTAPLGSRLRVTNLRNGRSVVVRINDRGPFVRGRIIDLSRAAAEQLDFIGSGVTRVSIERVEAKADEPATTASVPAPRPAKAETVAETEKPAKVAKAEKTAKKTTSAPDEVKIAMRERDDYLSDRGGRED